VFLLPYPVLALAGFIPTWLILVGVLVFGVIIAYGVLTTLRAGRVPWELRLDASAVTVHGGQAGADSGNSRPQPSKPRWLFWFLVVAGQRWFEQSDHRAQLRRV